MNPPLFRAQALAAREREALGAASPSSAAPPAQAAAASVPLLLQAESAECGLACLAMVAGTHGLRTDLPTLRLRFSVSAQGSTLADLVRIASALEFSPRALRAELDAVPTLQRPCVLHWDFDHFVVLVDWRDGVATLHDPARGRVRVPADEFARRFTGVALELTPTPRFEARDERRPLGWRELVGRVPGLLPSLALLGVVALGLEALVLAGPLLLQWTVDRALPAGDRGLVLTLAGGFAGLVLLQLVLAAARSAVVLRLSVRLTQRLSTRVFAHLVRLPLTWFERRSAGDVASRFGALQQLQRTLSSGLVEAGIDGLLVVATAAAMLATHPGLAAVAGSVALLYALLRALGLRALRHATEAALAAEARQAGHFLETLRGLATIRAGNGEALREARFAEWVAQGAAADAEVARLQARFGLVQRGLFGFERIAVVALGALWVLDGALTLGMLFAFLAWREVFAQRTAALVDQAVGWRLLRVALDRLADIVRSPLDESGASASVAPQAPGTPGTAEGRPPAIQLQDLRFRHAEGAPETLCGLDLTIAPGESVAIVGPSGAGKTTLVKLLLGLYAPTHGVIAVDGAVLEAGGRAAWRARVGAVLQDDALFAGTLVENISGFDPLPDRGWVEHCAQMAGIAEDIARWPMGYATRVGELGHTLSGGQRQRLLLARALYRRPQVLVLDEATSALDLDTERGVADALRRLPLTRIVVAHRPETIAACERVVTLAGGRVVADRRRDGGPAGEAVVSPASPGSC